jgi:hypothetical protein
MHTSLCVGQVTAAKQQQWEARHQRADLRRRDFPGEEEAA